MSKKKNFRINLKKLCLFICLIILGTCNIVYATNVQNSKPAAPYTKQAAEKITDLLEEYGLPPTPVKKNITSGDMLETYINYYIKIWGMAGYDFRKSIDKYIHDRNINPDALAMPPIYEYTSPEILGYATIQTFYQGNQDKLILKKYFSQETVNSFDKDLEKAQSGTSKYWFPQNVDASKLSIEQKSPYKILNENDYKYNYDKLVQQKVKEARMQGRPVIQKDLDCAERDYNILKNMRSALGSNLDVNSNHQGNLSQVQIAELNRIVNEYGIDILSVVGLRQSSIEKYLYTQTFSGQNNTNFIYEQTQSTTSSINDSPDRTDVMRFYNGNGYYPTNLNTVKNVVVPSAINKVLNYAFGLINY